MNKDPYKVLGVSPSASDDQIKEAYKELVRKFHPDQYQGMPISDVAEEKMAEINQAYDEIMTSRRGGNHYSFNGGSQSSGGNFWNGGSGSSNDSSFNNNAERGYYSMGFDSTEVRNLLNAGNVTRAEQILGNVNTGERNAEWYFLMGSVCYRRGWLNDAYSNFSRASSMEPSNYEYADAMNRMNSERSGNMYGNPMGRSAGRSDMDQACNCCSDLICLDCLCECMGGDLISCC